MSDKSQPPSRSRRLADIVREVKVAAAERDDVVVEMRDADRVRLELLAQDLLPIIEDIPADDDQFDFALSSGLQPRLWIDAVAHVHMGRDRRTYRFVRDTRLGRAVIAESAELRQIADAVSRYVAERLIQRQRVLEGDFESLRAFHTERPEQVRGPERERRHRASADDDFAPRAQAASATAAPAPPQDPAPLASVPPAAAPTPAAPVSYSLGPAPAPFVQNSGPRALLAGLIWFFCGCILGGLAIMAAFADRLAN
jgi:hypothetical protein